MIRLVVLGAPVTQGNKSGFVRGGRVVMVEGKGPGRQRHKDWRSAVTHAAQQHLEQHGGGLLDGPLVVRMSFGLPRPASAPKTRRTWPIKARSGDVDKLQRSILDSLTHVLFADDSQVVAVVAVKDFSPQPGVVIEVVRLDDTDDGCDWCHPAGMPHELIGGAA